VRLDEKHPDPMPETLVQILDTIAQKTFALAENEDENDNLRTELSANADRCRNFSDMLTAFTQRMLPDSVYFLDNDQDSVTCCAAPLNVAEVLEKVLFNGNVPVLLCSATMTVAGNFDYYSGRTGFAGGRMIQLDSPFSPEQAELLIPPGMPEPDSPEYLERLSQEIFQLVDENNGSAFVLFTSYRTLHFCADKLRDRFAARGITLLEQGGELDRSTMLRTFKSTPHSVLFGADSFWTGVDVPGDDLTLVIITRLPFASPGSPVIAARQERIEAAGKSSFGNYSLPEAVLKFRQGVGRLIRSRSDRGKVVVLDSRIIKKSYGRKFLDSIPYQKR
jgi:ATP-dependent DNA helicase DinG